MPLSTEMLFFRFPFYLISSYIFVIRTTFLISKFAVIFILSSLLHFALFCLPGTTPDSSSIMMHSLLLNHFAYASSYPVGGASEIAMNIIPVIERAGGRVFVRANGKCFYVDILSPMFILTLLEFKYCSNSSVKWSLQRQTRKF